MTERELEIEARFQGIQQVLSIALNLIADQDAVAERLAVVERSARQQNLHAATIEVIHSYARLWPRS